MVLPVITHGLVPVNPFPVAVTPWCLSGTAPEVDRYYCYPDHRYYRLHHWYYRSASCRSILSDGPSPYNPLIILFCTQSTPRTWLPIYSTTSPLRNTRLDLIFDLD
jgi:hypothetical protein